MVCIFYIYIYTLYIYIYIYFYCIYVYCICIYIILLYICILYIYILYIYIYAYSVYIYVYIYIYILLCIYILRIFIECSNMFIIHLANVMMTFFHHVSLLRFPGCDYSLVRLSFFLSVPMWGAIGVATCISPVPKKVAHWYMCEKHVIHLHIWGVTPSFLLELSGSKNNWRIKTGLCFFMNKSTSTPVHPSAKAPSSILSLKGLDPHWLEASHSSPTEKKNIKNGDSMGYTC